MATKGLMYRINNSKTLPGKPGWYWFEGLVRWLSDDGEIEWQDTLEPVHLFKKDEFFFVEFRGLDLSSRFFKGRWTGPIEMPLSGVTFEDETLVFDTRSVSFGSGYIVSRTEPDEHGYPLEL